jgi:NitT/TauT family transport system substrate-binding protein
MRKRSWCGRGIGLAVLAGCVLIGDAGLQSASAACTTMRKINIGVSVAPPNVVHTSPYVAKALGYFEKRCIDATIIQFEGGSSPAAKAAAAQGTALVAVTPVAIGRGVKVRQIWGLAPRLPQSYMVTADIKTAKDLKGKKLSAVGGGVGGFNWIMGRQVLLSAGLTVDDVQFIAGATAGRLPGLVSGQINGVSLHPESVFLAKQKNPGLHVLVALADLMPDFYYNAYGAQIAWIEKDHELMVDAVAAMIQANRTMYRDEAKVVPIIMKATGRPKDAVEYAWKTLTDHCVWSVNTGYDAKRTEWTVKHDFDVGYIKKQPPVKDVFDPGIANEAVKSLGGPITIGKCTQ